MERARGEGGLGPRQRHARALAGLEGCDLVVEACPENLALKRELFEALLAGICGPAAVLATNTSSLPVAEVAAGVLAPSVSAACTSCTPRR